MRLLNGVDRPRLWALRRADLYAVMTDRTLVENFAAMHAPATLRPGVKVDLDLRQ